MNHHHRIVVAAGSLALLASAACSAEEQSLDALPSYNSLDDVRQAVSDHLECQDDPPSPTDVMGDHGQIPTESLKCTLSVEIFHFESPDARNETYALLASTADDDGSVYFVEGRNWFVVDYAEAAVGGADSRPTDLAALAEALGARYSEVK